jgi:FemAB-related protein (PEP-CTERM system-associated)
VSARVDSSLVVRELDTSSCVAWDTYVETTPGATFFHLSGWRDVLSAEFGCRCHYLLAERDGRVAGVLPLAHVKNLIAGNLLVSTPFLVYGGPVGDDEEVLRALVAEAERVGERLGVAYIELRNRTPVCTDWTSRVAHVTFRRRLSETLEQNLSAVPRKQRAMIRKGQAVGLNVRWDHDIDPFYRVFSESYRNLGTPVFGKSLFTRLLSAFGDRVWLTTLWKDGAPVSGVLSFVFRDEVLPYYGGGGEAARDLYANDLMYWLVMERAVGKGLEVFDFGRSKVDSGSYRFKKHWGFEPEPLAYEYRLMKGRALPDLSPTNPKFRRPIEIWRRLPIPLTRVLGPPIARRLV